jgi:hypothetical protein
MSMANPTSEQIGALAQAFNQFNYFTTGSFRPGLWVAGNFSTIQYCSAYGGMAKIIPSVLDVVPYDMYFCQTLDRNETSYYKTSALLSVNKIRNGGVYSPTSSSSAHPTTTGFASWLCLGLIVTTAIATLVPL